MFTRFYTTTPSHNKTVMEPQTTKDTHKKKDKKERKDKNASQNPFFSQPDSDCAGSSSSDESENPSRHWRYWVTQHGAFSDTDSESVNSNVSAISTISTPLASVCVQKDPPGAPIKWMRGKKEALKSHDNTSSVVHNLSDKFAQAATKLTVSRQEPEEDIEKDELKQQAQRLRFRLQKEKIRAQTTEHNLSAALESVSLLKQELKDKHSTMTELTMENNDLRLKIAEYEREASSKKDVNTHYYDYAEDVEYEQGEDYHGLTWDEMEANCNYYRHEMIKWRKRTCEMIREYEQLEQEYESEQPIQYNYSHDEIGPWGHQDETE